MLLCLVFVMLSLLFIAALWSHAKKRLTSLLLFVMFVMFICVFVTFPCRILGQIRYLIVSISDICRLTYYDYKNYIIKPGLNTKPHIYY